MLRKYAATEILSATMAPTGAQALARYAHRHQFAYDPRPGYLYVRSRAISSRTNDNFDTFPADEIEKSYASFVGKPVFVNHNNENHHRARGVVIDAALHKDANPDGSKDTWVEVLMEVDAVRFPKLAQAIVEGHIDRTSMGTDVAYSLCSFCGNKATTPLEYCTHIPKMKGQRIYRTTASGKKEGVLISEICHGLKFFENSLLVEEPADPTAYFLGVEGHGVKTASKTAAWSEARHPNPIVHVMGQRPPRPLQTGDKVMHPDSGFTDTVTGHAPSLLMMQQSGIMHRGPMEGNHKNTIFGETADDRADLENKMNVGTADEQEFLKGNPDGPRDFNRRKTAASMDMGEGFADHIRQIRDWATDSHDTHRMHQKLPADTNNHADLISHLTGAHQESDWVHHAPHSELQAYHDDDHSKDMEEGPESAEWPDAVNMGGHHFHEAKRLPAGKPVNPRPIRPRTASSGHEVPGDRFMTPLSNCPHCFSTEATPNVVNGVHNGVSTCKGCNTQFVQHGNPMPLTAPYSIDYDKTQSPDIDPRNNEQGRRGGPRTMMPYDPTKEERLRPSLNARQVYATTSERGDLDDPSKYGIHDGYRVRMYPLTGSSGFVSGHKMLCDACAPGTATPQRHNVAPGTKCEHFDHQRNVDRESSGNGSKGDGYSEYHQFSHDPAVAGWDSDRHGVLCQNCAADKAHAGADHSEWSAIPKHLVSPHDECGSCGTSLIHAALASLHKRAYGEQMAPADVDTLRDEECPVCGEADAFDGQECAVCGFISPPKMFMDPDLDAAKQQDLRGDMQQEMLADPNGDGMPDVIPGSGNPGMDAPPMDAEQVPDPNDVAQQQVNQITDEQQPLQPEQLDENGQPIAQGNPMQQEQPQDPNADPMAPEDIAGQGQPGTPGDGVADLMCPVCGFSTDASQPTSVDMDTPTAPLGEIAEGALCPQCGQSPLVSAKQVQEQVNQQTALPMQASLFPVIRL